MFIAECKGFSDCYQLALGLEDQWNATLRQYGLSALASRDGSVQFWQKAVHQQWFSLRAFCMLIAAPHIANLMIAEDFTFSYANANRIRIKSEEYGNLLFPVDENLRGVIRDTANSPVCAALIAEFVRRNKVSLYSPVHVQLSINHM